MSYTFPIPYSQDTCEVREFSTFDEARAWAKGLHKPKLKDGFFVPRCESIKDYNIYMPRITYEIEHIFSAAKVIKQESKLEILHKDITDPKTVVFLVFKRIGVPRPPPSQSYLLFKKYKFEEAKEIGGEVWEQWKEEKVKRTASIKVLEQLGQEFIEAHKIYFTKQREARKKNM